MNGSVFGGRIIFLNALFDLSQKAPGARRPEGQMFTYKKNTTVLQEELELYRER